MTRNQILTAIVEALSEVTRRFVMEAGPRPHDPLVSQPRELLGHMQDHNADAAAANMVAYLTGLQTHLIQAQRRAQRRGQAAESKPPRIKAPATRRACKPLMDGP